MYYSVQSILVIEYLSITESINIVWGTVAYRAKDTKS